MTIDIDSTVTATIILCGANRDCHHSLTMCTCSLNVWLPPAVTIVCLTQQIPGLFTFSSCLATMVFKAQSSVLDSRLDQLPPCATTDGVIAYSARTLALPPKLSFIDLRRATRIGPSFGQTEDYGMRRWPGCGLSRTDLLLRLCYWYETSCVSVVATLILAARFKITAAS
jgi:hypothetical protein